MDSSFSREPKLLQPDAVNQKFAVAFSSGSAEILKLQSLLLGASSFRRFHVHEASQIAAIDEANHAVHLGKKRVVLAAPYVLARLQTSTALANDDRAAGNKLSTESLYSKPLCIRVAAIF